MNCAQCQTEPVPEFNRPICQTCEEAGQVALFCDQSCARAHGKAVHAGRRGGFYLRTHRLSARGGRTDAIPHSVEWFEILERTNPSQAALTREMLQSAGTDIACSMCGDEAVRDYRIKRATAIPDTWRLCADCLATRRKTRHEVFAPMIRTPDVITTM